MLAIFAVGAQQLPPVGAVHPDLGALQLPPRDVSLRRTVHANEDAPAALRAQRVLRGPKDGSKGLKLKAGSSEA